MNKALEQLLLNNGASLIGLARIEGLYNKVDPDGPRTEDSVTGPIELPEYPYGISILLALPKEVVRGIKTAPTLDYYDAYHRLNKNLDELANLCADYIREQGYRAYPQINSQMKEFGIFRTVMPHKTVAVHAGLGWIGKSALFVTKEYGSAVRLTSVLTDAPLNYNKDIPQSKCGECRICTEACPGKAISGRNWSLGLDRDEFFDAMACRRKAREIAAQAIDKTITLCGKCIEVCPHTRRYTEQSAE